MDEMEESLKIKFFLSAEERIAFLKMFSKCNEITEFLQTEVGSSLNLAIGNFKRESI